MRRTCDKMRNGRKVFMVTVAITMCALLILLGAEYVMRQRTGVRYYLPRIAFWKLDLHTNLCGQYDGKERYVLRHTGVEWKEEVAVKKSGSTKRIIILGTSSTEGYGVLREQTFVSILQGLLDAHYGKGRFEVINSGAGGYVSYQLLVYFQDVLSKLSPDFVILYSGHNDSSYRGTFSVREYYKKLEMVLATLRGDDTKKAMLLHYGLNGLNPLYRFLAESRLVGYVISTFFRGSPLSRLLSRMNLMTIEDQEYVLRKFAILSKESDFTLFFVPEAVRMRLARFVRPYHDLMKRVAEEQHIERIDFPSCLLRYPEDSVFLKDDPVHLNVEGNRLLAGMLYDIIQRKTKQ